jgi:hypothetical protein
MCVAGGLAKSRFAGRCLVSAVKRKKREESLKQNMSNTTGHFILFQQLPDRTKADITGTECLINAISFVQGVCS